MVIRGGGDEVMVSLKILSRSYGVELALYVCIVVLWCCSVVWWCCVVVVWPHSEKENETR